MRASRFFAEIDFSQQAELPVGSAFETALVAFEQVEAETALVAFEQVEAETALVAFEQVEVETALVAFEQVEAETALVAFEQVEAETALVAFEQVEAETALVSFEEVEAETALVFEQLSSACAEIPNAKAAKIKLTVSFFIMILLNSKYGVECSKIPISTIANLVNGSFR